MKKIALLFPLAMLAAPMEAASRLESFFSPGNSAEYSLRAEPGRDGSPDIVDQRLRGSQVIKRFGEKRLTATGQAALFHMSEEVVIPVTGVVFPESLWDVEGGLSYVNPQGDRQSWGGSFSVGSASNDLFYSIHEMQLQATLSRMIPSGQANVWLFLLNYSNNRTFLNNIPLPGFIYFWNIPKRGLRMSLGFPFLGMTYSPVEEWSTSLMFLGPTQQSVEVTRRFKGRLESYIAYERSPQQWLRTGRNDHSNRLIYDEKQALLGLRQKFFQNLSLDLSGGRTFDRRLFEARDASRSGAPRQNLANTWILRAALSLRWQSPPKP